jgi:hypothetical protein
MVLGVCRRTANCARSYIDHTEEPARLALMAKYAGPDDIAQTIGATSPR